MAALSFDTEASSDPSLPDEVRNLARRAIHDLAVGGFFDEMASKQVFANLFRVTCELENPPNWDPWVRGRLLQHPDLELRDFWKRTISGQKEKNRDETPSEKPRSVI